MAFKGSGAGASANPSPLNEALLSDAGKLTPQYGPEPGQITKFGRQLIALCFKTMLRDFRRPLHFVTILMLPALAGLGLKALGEDVAPPLPELIDPCIYPHILILTP